MVKKGGLLRPPFYLNKTLYSSKIVLTVNYGKFICSLYSVKIYLTDFIKEEDSELGVKDYEKDR